MEVAVALQRGAYNSSPPSASWTAGLLLRTPCRGLTSCSRLDDAGRGLPDPGISWESRVDLAVELARRQGEVLTALRKASTR